MQAKLKRGEAAFPTRRVGLSIAIFAGVPLIAALTLGAPGVDCGLLRGVLARD